MGDVLLLILVSIIIWVFFQIIKVTHIEGSVKDIIIGLIILVAVISIPAWIANLCFMIHPVLGVIVSIPCFIFVLYVLGGFGRYSNDSDLWNNEGP